MTAPNSTSGAARPLGRRRLRTRVVLGLVAVLLALGTTVAPRPTEAAPRWAPAASAPIHPGALVHTQSGLCTANFVWLQGSDAFIGTAAHCFGAGGNGLNGCVEPVRPLGSPVRIEGATKLGQLAYSSWSAMQATGEDDPRVCLGNDFALIRLDPADHGRVNPSIPHWGGPTGLRNETVRPFASLYSYGRSFYRGETPLLRPMLGVATGSYLGGWRIEGYHVLPGIPGDSGGPTVDRAGRATGIMSGLGLFPAPAINAMSSMWLAYQYARAHGVPNLQLALGTEPFNPNQLPIG